MKFGLPDRAIILDKKYTVLTAAGYLENKLKKVSFSRQYGRVIKLLSVKITQHLQQQGAMRISPTDQSIILDKKSTKLTAAVCREKYLRKVCFLTAIRHSYKTLVCEKNHGTHGSKVP